MKTVKSFESFKTLNENHDEMKNYMFFQNLKTIKNCVDRMLELDSNNVDELMNDHDWASDHIATSKDDIQEVCDFLCNMVGDSNSTHEEHEEEEHEEEKEEQEEN